MQRLNGEIAVITGASRGIGKATARLLAAGSVTVVLSALRHGSIAQLAAEPGDGN